MIDADWIPTQKPLFMVRICINKRLNTDKLPSCAGRQSRGLADLLERRVLAEGIPATIMRGPCMNNCAIGPNLKIQGGEFFNLNDDLSDANIEKIMTAIRAEAERRIAAAAAEPAAPESDAVMMIVLIAAAIGVAAIIGAALILPCEGCRLRRERMRRAYAEWQARKRGGV